MNRQSTIVIIGLCLLITAVASAVVYVEWQEETSAPQQSLPSQVPVTSSSATPPQGPSTGRPLGPETEQFFDEVMDRLQALPPEPEVPMVWGSQAPCDLNGDGHCDATDFQLFQSVLGRCRQDFRTPGDFFADIDGDGCVTAADQKMLFPDTPR